MTNLKKLREKTPADLLRLRQGLYKTNPNNLKPATNLASDALWGEITIIYKEKFNAIIPDGPPNKRPIVKI